MSKGERADKLRRRPDVVRYFYLAVSNTTLHTGMSHGGLTYVYKNHGVQALYVADLLTEKVTQVKEPVEEFMAKWKQNYNNTQWDYAKEVENNG